MVEISATKAAHTRQHAFGTKALVCFGRGDWSGVQAIGKEIRALVETNPDASWCLMGANAIGYDAIGGLLRSHTPPSDARALVERMLPEAPATRAAVLLLPSALAGATVQEDEARRSYARETIVWERESAWDVAGVNLVLAQVATERWSEAEAELPRIDRLAEKGAGFAAALATAIREEIASARGGPKPQHERLHSLGYEGISELLSYRVRESRRVTAGAR